MPREVKLFLVVVSVFFTVAMGMLFFVDPPRPERRATQSTTQKPPMTFLCDAEERHWLNQKDIAKGDEEYADSSIIRLRMDGGACKVCGVRCDVQTAPNTKASDE